MPNLLDHFITSTQEGRRGVESPEYTPGEVIESMNRFGPNFARLRRPFLDRWGRAKVIVNTGRWTAQDTKGGERKPIAQAQFVNDLQNQGWQLPLVVNATSLRKEDWIELDRTVVMAQRNRLTAWDDLAASSSYGSFNAMNRMTLEYEAMSDPGEAVVDMDAIADGRTDTPLFKLRSVPLPITHSDFWYSARRIGVSSSGGTPLDKAGAEWASRRVAEMIEATTIGTVTGVQFGSQTAGYGAHDGDSQVYGYTNFPSRVTKTDLTTPTGINPEAVLADVLEMVETMEGNDFYGPYVLYHSTAYSRWLNDDYFRTGSTSAVRSVRERLLQIGGIQDIKRLDNLSSGYQLILVQLNDSNVAQAINGMDTTVVQWESQGGMRLNFKVMAIKVPLLKAPYDGVSGILHATTS